jgi:hypothetical protein
VSFIIPEREGAIQDGMFSVQVHPPKQKEIEFNKTIPVSLPKTIIHFIPESGFIISITFLPII